MSGGHKENPFDHGTSTGIARKKGGKERGQQGYPPRKKTSVRAVKEKIDEFQ